MTDEIETALRENTTLPPHWYTDQDILTLEQDAVFGPSWQFACHIDKLVDPGDQFPVRCGDIPIVVVRDKARELRAYVNVCRHRGHEVVLQPEPGHDAVPLHGWTFGLDGALRAAPRERREDEVDRSLFPLFPAAVETWAARVRQPRPVGASLHSTLGTPEQVALENRLDLSRMVMRDYCRYNVRGNWKIALDNMLERDHCPTGHPGFNEYYDVDPATNIIQLDRSCSYQRGNLREKPEAQAHKTDWGDFELYFVWPNTIIIPGPVQCIVMPMIPVAPDRTILARRRTSSETSRRTHSRATSTLRRDLVRGRRAHRVRPARRGLAQAAVGADLPRQRETPPARAGAPAREPAPVPVRRSGSGDGRRGREVSARGDPRRHRGAFARRGQDRATPVAR